MSQQQETRMGQNKPRNGRWRVFENRLIRFCCFRQRIFLLLAFEASFAFLLASKKTYCGKYRISCSIGRRFVFNFRLRGYPA